MSALLGPYVAAALLLAAAGVSKVARPASTVTAVRAAGVPVNEAAVRVFAAVEVLVAASALLLGGPVAPLLVALSYAAFALFVGLALVRGESGSCGCFAGDDAPPTLVHVVVNVGLAVSALAVAVNAGPSSLPAVLADAGPAAALTLVGLAGLVAVLGYLVLTRLPGSSPAPAAVAVVDASSVVDDSPVAA
ncbi:MAG: hypothetical protein M3211_03990 [Actinomycetota bacterium]|nr:hypothetical protein [Actinomycetota bacterium]